MDDDESILELVSVQLRGAGYDVRLAEDAIVAGHMVLASLPELIIVDVDMPYMDGFEFVAALKADKTLPDFPLIFLTALEDGEARSKELGAVGCVVKPVRADRLLEVVARHMPSGTYPIG